MTVFVGGGIARRPLNGGGPWVRLSWVRGLRRLGVDAYLVDGIPRGACVDAHGRPAAFRDSLNLEYFRLVQRLFGLEGSSALVYDDGAEVFGATPVELLERAAAADLYVSQGYSVTWRPLLRRLRRKVFLDIDPGFTQLVHRDDPGRLRLDEYDLHYTFGANIGTPECPIPTGGIRWRVVRQPVVLDDWPVVAAEERDRLTTVSVWRGRPFPGFGDETLKAAQLRRFAELPRLVPQRLEIALNTRAPKPLLPLHAEPVLEGADDPDVEALRRAGWHLVDPREVAGDPLAFRRYVQRSGGEVTVTRGLGVETWNGFFGDRTVRYLASGKPVLVQDTGFGRTLPTGEGLVPFTGLEDAAAGARSIAEDYDRHCRAARAIAEEFFDSDRVIGGVLEDAGVAP